jgi:hypothetical protein
LGKDDPKRKGDEENAHRLSLQLVSPFMVSKQVKIYALT